MPSMSEAKKKIQTKGVTVWFTGLPSSGKSTLARLLERKCKAWGFRVELLDGDVIRTNLNKGLGFSREDREVNVKRLGFVSHLLTRNDVMSIVSAVSPYRGVRDENRKLIGNYVEVYVKASPEACQERDVKGLYKKAKAGEIKGFTGVDDPYEAPDRPDVLCDTETEDIEVSLEKVIAALEKLGYIKEIS